MYIDIAHILPQAQQETTSVLKYPHVQSFRQGKCEIETKKKQAKRGICY